jgi:anti-sigma factor RsiW
VLSEADFHAYADGQLPAERIAAVEAALASDPALASRVAEVRAQNAALRDALDPALAEPIPARLLQAAATPAGARSPVARWGVPVFAVAATLLIGLMLGWFGREMMLERQGTLVSFPRQAAFTHALYAADPRRPVEVWASEEKSLVAWLTKRLGHPVHSIDLSAAGFSLVGGRLVAGNQNPTALFMYENADKQRVTVQIRWEVTPSGETAFRYAVENGVGVFYWIEDGAAYAISGNIDRGQLLSISRSVYGQLAAISPPRTQ